MLVVHNYCQPLLTISDVFALDAFKSSGGMVLEEEYLETEITR